ncbi:MAG: cytochrome c maturation protein CcmE [Chitinophagales bacterium]|nr:cytochrome c maturation protein CcmE [Chitinophagales bacterium]MDW8418947.1 cytochrome c maturation protein CcmE [Chitinophagales bacterium]
MKKLHILLLALMAVGIGMVIAMSFDWTTYSTFNKARGRFRAVNISGYLVKSKEMYYNPEKDPNFFSFTMVDDSGTECKVVYRGAKPQDFERSEKIVVKGKMDGDVFRCSEISMKCPSKYVNDNIVLKEKENSKETVTYKAGP